MNNLSKKVMQHSEGAYLKEDGCLQAMTTLQAAEVIMAKKVKAPGFIKRKLFKPFAAYAERFLIHANWYCATNQRIAIQSIVDVNKMLVRKVARLETQLLELEAIKDEKTV